MSLSEVFRDNLRAATKAHPLPVKAISYKAGYNCDYVRKVISGHKPNPTLQFVESIAQVLGMTPTELLTKNGSHHD